MIEAVLSCVVGITVLVSAILLCAGCRESKKAQKEVNNKSNGSLLRNNGTDREKAASPEKLEVNQILKDGSLSRMSSVSSHASVRITLTNAEIDNDLDSPVSNVSSYMAERELPELPKCPDEDEDHDYDTVENLPPNSWVRYQPPVTQDVEYDTLDIHKEAEYYTLGDVNAILDRPSAEYATVEQPEYATVEHPQYATVNRPDYATVDHVDQEYDEIANVIDYHPLTKKASYEVLPEDIIQRSEPLDNRSRTLSPRPFSEGFATSELDSLSNIIDKRRAGSERKPRDNDDSMSVIYASINPEFRRQRVSEEELEQHYSIVSNDENAPPLPENPYAMLDNLLADLKIPQPAPEAHYEDLENLRPASTNIEGVRRVNPIIANSSPFAIVNPNSRTSSQIQDVEDEVL